MDINVVKGSSKEESEEKWLQARAAGVTATQVAQLVVYGKLAGAPSPSAEPYMQWGLEREAHLLEMARHKFQGETIISNDQVMYSSINPRYLATPDGFSDTTIYECKTMKSDYFDRFEQGTWMEIKPLKRYFYQVQWQLLVMRADSATLIYEERLGSPGGFEPGRVGFVEISPDPVAMAECIAEADKQLEEQEAAATVHAVQPPVEMADLERWCASMAQSTLIHSEYRNKPANILYAVELAKSINLSPMVAITSLQVISGKPTLSADMIATLVRKAGHTLRVSGDDMEATATITRCDDPEFTFKAVWNRKRAERAGLWNKGTWRQYPEAMLKARAITEVARMGAQDALGGVKYTPEELS